MQEIITRKESLLKGLPRYFTGKPCKRGHTAERNTKSRECLLCRDFYREKPLTEEQKERKRLVARRYRQENKGKVSESKKRYEINNRNKINAAKSIWINKNREKYNLKRVAWYEKNKEERRKYAKEWAKQNKEKICSYARTKRKRPSVKIAEFMRKCLYRIMERKTGKTSDLLEYSGHDLLIHIEIQFKKGMSWDNYGEWHIDHITPISIFIERGITDPKQINCLSNIRPVWAKDNLSKGAKMEFLI